jgi:hypothetical protein
MTSRLQRPLPARRDFSNRARPRGQVSVRNCASASLNSMKKFAAFPRRLQRRKASSISSGKSSLEWLSFTRRIWSPFPVILQRDQTRLQGERGRLIADIARARGKISETELQIIQLDQDFRTEVLKDLREAQGKIAELKERVTAAEDQLKRVDLRAPQAGTVHQLAVHTVGGVIANGETIMQIVPRADELVVEAKVAPYDIDQVGLGATATVRIMAGNQRTTPVISGRVSRVSADIAREQQQQNSTRPGQPYYMVRIALPADEVARLKDIHLVPGITRGRFYSDPAPIPAKAASGADCTNFP